MGVKVFLLGLPGSGKSTAARYINEVVNEALQNQGWTTKHVNDYDILYSWAQTKSDLFSKTEHDGFDVHNHIVFDRALQELEQQQQELKEKEIILIEFARNDYCKALKFFTAPFLHDAYFFFLNAEIPTCKSRIHYRTTHPTSKDDHFVSEYIFETYYDKSSNYFDASEINSTHDVNDEQYDIKSEHIKVIDNTAAISKQEFFDKIKTTVLLLIGQENAEVHKNTRAQVSSISALAAGVQTSSEVHPV